MKRWYHPTSAIGASAALALLAMPTPALAADFTPEGARMWVATAQSLIHAANTGTDEMGAACQGVSLFGGGILRKESGQVPKWAVMAHLHACMAYQSVASRDHGKAFMKDTHPCKSLLAAAGELDNAKPGVDPEEVVAIAGKLKTTLASLAADYKDAKTCKRAVGRLF